ncbi:MAG: hypothetical protein DI543_11065 [Bradyrhizobium icense]|nr:MAG: hypothetical protein DI543_11065 [Bradyrhizobium icense]
MTSINQSVGAGFVRIGRTEGREKVGPDAAGRRGGGPRSNMTQGAKIKEIVQLRSRENASGRRRKPLED